MTEQEINEAIARKLGWKKIESDGGLNGWWRGPLEEIVADPDFPEDTSLLQTSSPQVSPYCTSISAAWEIMEKTKCLSLVPTDKGWHVSSSNGKAEEGECIELWYPTNCMTRNEDGCLKCAIADTAPMAIALAFLKLKD